MPPTRSAAPARATPTPPRAAASASTTWGRRAGPPPPELAPPRRDPALPDYSNVYQGLRRSERERFARDPEYQQSLLERHRGFVERADRGENPLESYDFEFHRWQNRYDQRGPNLLEATYDGVAGMFRDLYEAGVESMYLGLKYALANTYNGSTAPAGSVEGKAAAEAMRGEAARGALDLAVVSGAKAVAGNSALVRSVGRAGNKAALAIDRGFAAAIARDPHRLALLEELDERNAYETALANYEDEKTAANFHRDVTAVLPWLEGVLGTTEVNQRAAAGWSNVLSEGAGMVATKAAQNLGRRMVARGEVRAAQEAIAERRRALASAQTLQQLAKASPEIEDAAQIVREYGARAGEISADIAQREAGLARAMEATRQEIPKMTGAAAANRAATRATGTLGEAVEATSDFAERLEALPPPLRRQIAPEVETAKAFSGRPLGLDTRPPDVVLRLNPASDVLETAALPPLPLPDPAKRAAGRALDSGPIALSRPLVEAAGRTVKAAASGVATDAAIGALTTPDDPLAGAFAGAGTGFAFGLGVGGLAQWRSYDSPGQVRREQAAQRRAYRERLELRPDEAAVFDQLPESTQTAIAHYSAANPDLIIRYIDDPSETAGRYSSAEPDRVTINRAAREPLEAIFGHEAGHAISADGRAGPAIERALLGDAEAGIPGDYTLRDADGAPVLAPDGQSYAVDADFDVLRQRYLDRLDARAMEAGWSAERHVAARRPYEDPRHVARELAAEQYAQYLASPQYRRDLKGGARGGYFEAGEILQSVPFLQNSLGRLGFVFDRTGEIVHSPLFGDYRKSPGVAQAVREYTRARVRERAEGGGAKSEIDGSLSGAESSNATPRSEVSFFPSLTRHKVRRNNPKDWRATRNLWDSLNYGEILSPANRSLIAKGLVPLVDEHWIRIFPEDEGLFGEKISIHHIGGLPITTPLSKTRHDDSHTPNGYRYNPGGPGGQAPIYPKKRR